MEEKKKRKKWLLLLALLLLLIGGYSVYHYFFATEPQAMSVISGDFLPEGKDAKQMSEEEIADLAQQKADASNFNMMIASEATISGSTQQGQLPIKNPESNVYPINVEIKDDESGEIIYTSGAILPGEEIDQIQLDQPLEKGTHKTTALFSLYDPQTKKKQGEVSAGVTISVN
ncbi:hypothetical protein JZO70_09940 [Enterococcus sp. 669A]|uniref:Uncharacterized protein n=1 Tax=Candidatus Enterococcus moelleringii TaxID=2815325 RepID=A0ABS3LBT4_9ENTE|nr:hypothetical protein [Enterococcus sp. 669A]MBO1306483.1 hypothetical protein [Enterococcus sp. 669A]